MKLVSIVIPVYFNEGSLALTYSVIKDVFQKLENAYNFELIFINDGSKDGSLQELLSLIQTDDRVKVIDLSRNFGQVQAITAGINFSKGDLIISLSADLQDPIEKIPEMITEFENGHDVVICNRIQRNDKFKDKVFASLFYQLMRTSNIQIPPGGFDMFLLSKKAYTALKQINESNRYLHADILWLGFSIKLIPAERKERTIGKSQYSFWKRVNSLLLCYFNTSNLPLRAMSVIGIFFAIVGFIYAIFITFSYFVNKTPFKGWAPIMILILIIGGLIMIMLGIIGEYLWRTYDESKKRPYYIVKNIYDKATHQQE